MMRCLYQRASPILRLLTVALSVRRTGSHRICKRLSFFLLCYKIQSLQWHVMSISDAYNPPSLSYMDKYVVPVTYCHFDHGILDARMFIPFFVARYSFVSMTITSPTSACISSAKNVPLVIFLIVTVSICPVAVRVILRGQGILLDAVESITSL